ncbi:MAG: hypothetical protein U5N86_06180 [Planctomycetota bacterium]|nr:hypothetical protein [Planctomycetota bacterium]
MRYTASMLSVLLISFVLVAASAGAEIGPVFPEDILPQERPVSPEAVARKAGRLINQRYFNEAIEFLRKAYNKIGPHPELLRAVGQLANISGCAQYADQLAAFYQGVDKEQLRAWEPETLKDYFSYLLTARRFREARKLFRDICEISQDAEDPNMFGGALQENLEPFLASFGLPYLFSENITRGFITAPADAYSNNLEHGNKMFEKGFYVDALVGYRRALVYIDGIEAALGAARCWMLFEDYDRALSELESVGADSEEAKAIIQAAKVQKNIFEKTFPRYHPYRIGNFRGVIHSRDLHHIAADDKYFAGISEFNGIQVFSLETLEPVFEYSNPADTIVDGEIKRIADDMLFIQSLQLEKGKMLIAQIEMRNDNRAGKLDIVDIENKKHLCSIKMDYGFRTASSVHLSGGYVFTAQRKGSRAWISVFDAQTGEELFRRTGVDDLIGEPLLIGSQAVVPVTALGFGKLDENWTSKG